MDEIESASTVTAPRAGSGALLAALRRADASRPALIAALLVACAYAVRVQPLDVTCLAAAARVLSAGAGWSELERNYSHAHGRPCEVSPGFAARKKELAARLAARAAELDAAPGPLPARLARFMREHDAATIELHRQPATDWKYLDPYSFYQASPALDVPILWLLERSGLSEVHPGLWTIASVWAGFLALVVLTRRATGSALAGLAAVALVPASLVLIPQCRWGLSFLPTVTIILAAVELATPAPAGGCRAGRARWLLAAREVAALAVLAAQAVLMLFVWPSLHRMESLIAAGLVVVSGLAARSPRVVARGLVAVALVVAATLPYQRYAMTLWEPLTTWNHAANASFVPVSGFWGISERPSPYGLPPCDTGFTLAFHHDPFISRHAFNLAVHHSLRTWGVDFLADLARNHPLEVPRILARRLFTQVAFFRECSFGLFAGPHGSAALTLALLAVLVTFGLALLPLASPAAAGRAWPIAGVVLWNLFGVHTLFTVIHLHSDYLSPGVFLSLCMLPAMLGALARAAAGALAVDRPRSRTRTAAAVLAAVAAILVLPALVREARREAHAFRAWFAIHSPLNAPFHLEPPRALLADLDALAALGGVEPGAAEMHAAWCLFAYLERLDGYRANHRRMNREGEHDWDAYRRELAAGILERYRQALDRGAANPHFASHAMLIGDPDWPQVYRRALDRWPDHPYAAYMADRLSGAGTLAPGERRHYARLSEDQIGRDLARTSRVRPGHVPEPVPAAPPRAALERTPEGVRYALAPGESLVLPDVPVLCSDRLAVAIYARVESGTAEASLHGTPGAGLLSTGPLRPDDERAYRILAPSDGAAWTGVECAAVHLAAGARGATVVVRDLYPLNENPRFFRSGSLVAPAAAREARRAEAARRAAPRSVPDLFRALIPGIGVGAANGR
jgi:hypothetical protein